MCRWRLTAVFKIMSLLPKFKIGDCSIEGCGLKKTQGRKVGKLFYCLNHYRTMKVKQQVTKATERNKVRSLIYRGDTKWEGALPLPPYTEMGKGRIVTTFNSTAELQRWFELRHSEMKGKCQHCGSKTQKGQTNYKCSIAHLLPKEFFKSVATHPSNWIELCFYNKSCHTNFDNKMLGIIELNCFDEVIRKFVAIYPFIAENEKRRIPQVLLNYLEVEK